MKLHKINARRIQSTGYSVRSVITKTINGRTMELCGSWIDHSIRFYVSLCVSAARMFALYGEIGPYNCLSILINAVWIKAYDSILNWIAATNVFNLLAVIVLVCRMEKYPERVQHSFDRAHFVDSLCGLVWFWLSHACTPFCILAFLSLSLSRAKSVCVYTAIANEVCH